MDPLHNPFSPGAGAPPKELAGRSDILDHAALALGRVKRGRSEKSMFLAGLRGVGKTVLLHRISEMAEKEGYQVAVIEASENKPLSVLLLPHLRKILFALDRGEKVSAVVKQGFKVLKSFLKTIRIKVGGFEMDLNADPEKGVADSGDLETDLADLFIAFGEAAKDRETAVAIIIDEIQYLKEEDFEALIMAIHRVAQKALPIIVIGAGLPQLAGKAGEAKSYAERLFNFPAVGPLKPEDAKIALQDPVKSEGAVFSDEALDEIISVTKGYPYFIQEWGYQAWNMAAVSPIDLPAVREATREAVRRLDENFFSVRFNRLTPREKEYLRALAEIGPGSHRSGDIAEVLGMKVNTCAPLRNSLIKKGMIYAPNHGDTEFTVPLFDEYMKRVIPDLTRKERLRP